jgi:hypothetical protein
MDVLLESVHNKVTTAMFPLSTPKGSKAVLLVIWCLIGYYSDPDSLTQLCGITTIELLETMFDACGFNLPGKFSPDALMNFVQGVPTCDVTEEKPSSFKKKHMFLTIGRCVTQKVAS